MSKTLKNNTNTTTCAANAVLASAVESDALANKYQQKTDKKHNLDNPDP